MLEVVVMVSHVMMKWGKHKYNTVYALKNAA